MIYAALLVALSALALLLASSYARGQDSGLGEDKPQAADSADAASVKRSEVRERLLRLAEQPPPEKLSMGAMCYDMATPPERIDYVCPTCGEKTIYASGEPGADGRRYKNTAFLQWDLPACRRIIGQIKGARIELDESQFCAKCSPDVETPVLVLLIYYSGEQEPYKVAGVTLDDLKLLREFFAGEDTHTGAQDLQTPLKNHLARLGELLGVEVKTDR